MDRSVSPKSSQDALTDIWGNDDHQMFAVGENGAIVHYHGGTWMDMTSGTDVRLSGVWGSYNNDVFTVGLSGTILHYDGDSWMEMITWKRGMASRRMG